MSWNSRLNELRRRAEDVLNERESRPARLLDMDLLSLLYELEVHEVELQMQCEELNRANKELRDSEARYADLYDLAPVGYFSLDLKGTIVQANTTGAQMLGTSKAHLLERNFIDHVYRADLHTYALWFDSVWENRGKHSMEVRLTRKDGSPFHVQLEAASARRRQHIRMAMVDVSERKAAEEALRESEKGLRSLSQKLFSIQEEERKRISGDLHDSIGSSLSAVKFSLESLQGSLKPGTEAVHAVEELVAITGHIIDETRRIMYDLRPSILDDIGLLATISWLCRGFEKTYPHVRVETEIETKEEEIPQDLKITIFRILQEALHNVAKHSQADWVRVSIAVFTPVLVLEVEDKGLGFDCKARNEGGRLKGFGLAGMKERTELSGGTFTVESDIGKGVRISARWQLMEWDADSR